MFCNVSDHLWTDQDALDLHSFEDKNSINLDSLEIQNFDSQKAEMILRVLALLAEVTKDSRSEIRHGKEFILVVVAELNRVQLLSTPYIGSLTHAERNSGQAIG